MALKFKTLDDGSGVFEYTAPDDTVDELDCLLDQFDSDGLSEKVVLAALERLASKAPDFIDAYAHIATFNEWLGKPKKALEAALRGLGVGNALIPEGFAGRIEWSYLDNRPYLRAMHVAVMAYIRLARHKDAAALIEVMLARNPDDNQGVRFLLGSELMRLGAYDRAQVVMEEWADEYPAYYYELALCHVLQANWVAAATALRRGFVTNPYIGEFLAGNPDPQQLVIWHDTNFAEPELLPAYFEQYGALWSKPRHGGAFVRWLFNHPKVMAERARIMEFDEALLWEAAPEQRARLRENRDEAIDSIDDTLSMAIVQQRTGERGTLVWPWLYSQRNRAPAW